MKLNKAGFWVWPASLGPGFCLAYSVVCHWFGFLYAGKINRLVMLLVFGAIFSFLSWQFLKWASRYFFGKISWRRFYIYVAPAVVITAAAALFVMPLSQNSLILQPAQPGGTFTTVMRFLWFGLKLADFVSLACVLLVGEAFFSTIVTHWESINRFINKIAIVFPTFGIVLVICLFADVYISAADKAGTLHQLKPLSSNSLLSLVWNKTYTKEARGYTILFEYYQGWTLVAPAGLLIKMGINEADLLQRWGRIGTVVIADYPTDLSKQEMEDLLALKNANVENGSGQQYIAILEGDSNRNICLRTYGKNVFIVPVSLSPICEN